MTAYLKPECFAVLYRADVLLREVRALTLDCGMPRYVPLPSLPRFLSWP